MSGYLSSSLPRTGFYEFIEMIWGRMTDIEVLARERKSSSGGKLVCEGSIPSYDRDFLKKSMSGNLSLEHTHMTF